MKNKNMTRRQRIAVCRRTSRIERKANELLPRFESGMFMMHSPSREYDDSIAAKELVRIGRAAMRPIAAYLQRIYAYKTGSSESYWRQFTSWTYLVNDMLRKVGRHSPYSGKTPYINQSMHAYIQACLDCADGNPEAAQIHAPLKDVA